MQSPLDVHPTLPKFLDPQTKKNPLVHSDSTAEADEISWVHRFEEMGLPSFRPLYMFLVRIPLDVLHECMRLRLEQRPEADPSLLSVRQVSTG